MALTWLGKYEGFVAGLVEFGNAYARNYDVERNYNTPVEFSASEVQILEYILQNEDRSLNMAETATRLGIPQSTFSKTIKRIVKKGLLEKYQISNNRKEIIIRVSDYGKEVYKAYCEYAYNALFRRVFEILDEIPEEYVAKFTQILKMSAEGTHKTEEPRLIKMTE